MKPKLILKKKSPVAKPKLILKKKVVVPTKPKGKGNKYA